MTLLLAGAIAFSTNDPMYTLAIAEQAWLQPGTAIVNPQSPKRNAELHSLSAYEMISWFRQQGLPVATIAEISRVERKSVYAWMNNGPIHLHNQERLEKLYTLLSENRQTPLLHFYRFWKRTLASGKSLASLLTDKNLNERAIKAALLELAPMAKKAQQMTAKATKTHRNNNPFVDDLGEATLNNGS